MCPFICPSEGRMVKLLSSTCPVSAAAASEVAERLLTTEAELTLYEMLFWGAVGVMGAAVVTTRIAWAQARDMRERTVLALTAKEKANQVKVEVSTSPTQAVS